jgi:hypothetical protein
MTWRGISDSTNALREKGGYGTLGESLLTVLHFPASAHEGASFPMDVLLATL